MRVANSLGSRGYSRRDFLKAGGGALLGAYALGLAGCGGSQSGSGGMTFQTWAGPAEEEGFRTIVDTFNKQNPDANVKLEIVPFEQQYEKLDTRLAAGDAPDLVRIQYQQMGRYASEGTLVDLSEYVPSGYPEVFAPAFRQSVSYEGGFYGVPQHTDGWAIYYNVGMLDKAGVDVPKTLEDSWTWDEFLDVANTIKRTASPTTLSPRTGRATRMLTVGCLSCSSTVDNSSTTA